MLNKIFRFGSDRSGNFAMMSVLVSVPLLLATGLGVDYARHSAAHRHLQELADAASLTLAGTEDMSEATMHALAEDVLAANLDGDRLRNVVITELQFDNDRVDIALRGDIPTTFMGIAGVETLETQATSLAERAVKGTVEVALIVDNTYSMVEVDAKGVSKIDALKSAARQLVNGLLQTEDGAVKIGLVPYADYVNVGTKYRNAPWLDVPADYNREKVEATCTMVEVTTKECIARAPKRTCTRYVDGVPENYSCGNECTEYGPPVTTMQPDCEGGVSAASFKWYGCVGSRMPSDDRLHDKNGSVRYPGYIDTSQKCLNPLVTLTSDKSALLTAVDGMIIRIGGYKPYTYIPAGLIWGQNVLNPGAPFEDAAAYDAANEKPRKVAVLMTDGENTLRFNSANGKHVGFSSNATTAAKQLSQTNADTVAICDYMKAQNIEIYTVAFMLDNDAAKDVLESCATDAAHFYDASDSEKLVAAFGNISDALRVVRLAR